MGKFQLEEDAFSSYAKKVRKLISLLDNFQLPPKKDWNIDWNLLREISQINERRRWSRLCIYRELLDRKTYPMIYYFTTDKKGAKQLFELFTGHKKEASQVRIHQGVGAKGYLSISHAPKVFQEGTCMYVGSRKKTCFFYIKYTN